MPSSSTSLRLQSRVRAGLLTERYTYQPGTHRLGGIATPGWRGWKTANVLSDAAGNIVRMPRQGQSLDLDYAANNRLTQVAKAGQVVGSYVYDANGLRAQKTTGSHARQFIYDDQAHLLGDYAPDLQQKREYLWLEGTLVATLDTSTQGMSVHYVATDFLGTPRRVVNTGGYPVWGWAYAGEAFGDTPALGAYDLAMRFPGQYHDVESGLNYNVHRDYDAATGRYVESDPIGLRGGVSTYLYALANPASNTDALGLWVKICSRLLGNPNKRATSHYNPLSHMYLNVSGQILSFQAGDNMFWSQGRLENDEDQNKGCDTVCSDPKFDSYVLDSAQRIGAPTYCLIAYPGTLEYAFGARNCQTWAMEVLSQARSNYLEAEHCPTCFRKKK